jgi:abortive infection bacteriophage resistance protein
VISFGTLLTFFRGLDSKGKKIIAKKYGLHAPVLESWLLALNTIRNICAHHSRLFNRTFGTRPVYPEKEHLPQWYDPFKIETEKAFAILSILHYLLKIISPQSAWKCRLNTLMDDYSDIPVQIMGFPENWKEHAIWK